MKKDGSEITTRLLSRFKKLKEIRLTKEILLVASSSTIVNILNFLFFAILSRYITIDSLGILNAQIGILIVIANIVPLGIPPRIMHLSNQERVYKKILEKKIYELIWGLILICLLSASIYYLIIKFNSNGNLDFPFLLISLILIIPISDAFNGYLYGKRKVLLSSIFLTIEPLARIVFLLIFLNWIKLENIYEKDIYIIYIFSSFISLFFLIYLLSKIGKFASSINIFKRPKLNINTYTESLQFGVPALTRTLSQWSPLIIISYITSPEVAGTYFIYSRFVMLITAIPQKIIEAVIVPILYEENKSFKKLFNKYRFLIVIILLFALFFLFPFLFNFLDKKVFPNYQEILSLKIPIYIVSSSIFIKLFNYIIEYRYIAQNQLQLLSRIKINSLIVSMVFVCLIATIYQNTYIFSRSVTAALCIIIFEFIAIIFSKSSLHKLNN